MVSRGCVLIDAVQIDEFMCILYLMRPTLAYSAPNYNIIVNYCSATKSLALIDDTYMKYEMGA